MIIRMTDFKSLVISKDTKIYQRENIIDNFIILLPLTYNGIDLSKFTVTWEYVDPKSTAHSEILELSEELYKDTYLQYSLPIDSEMTYFTGNITAKISAVWVDLDTTQTYVLHTGEITIPISPLSDYYIHTDSSTLETIDNKIADLNAKIGALDMIAEKLQFDQIDDLSLTDTLLQVSSKGVPKGTGVEILTNMEDLDGENDGIIDLTNAIDDGSNQINVVPIIEL